MFHEQGDKLHIKLALAPIDRCTAAEMDALHIREIQLYSYNQLQFLTERDWRKEERLKKGGGGGGGRNKGGELLRGLCEVLLLIL